MVKVFKYANGAAIKFSDKKKMNGRYQVGSGRIVAVTHDTPFIEDIVSHSPPIVNSELSEIDKAYLENKTRKGFIQKAFASIVSIVNMLKNKEFAVYITNLHNIDRQREDKPVIPYTNEDIEEQAESVLRESK